MSHSCETPLRFKQKNENGKTRSIYYTAASVGIYCVLVVECDCKRTIENEKKKRCHRKQMRWYEKKIEESLGNLWNAYAFEEPIVYRICAAARKHVNQLNSTRFPNVIKKN